MFQSKGCLVLYLGIGIAVVFSCSSYTGEVPTVGSSNFDDIVGLFEEWREFQKPSMADGIPDYSTDAMTKQYLELERYQDRLEAIDPSSWPVSQQVDYHIVRAEMNGLDFDHRVLRPWSRNPCFYAVCYTSPSDLPALEGPCGGMEHSTCRNIRFLLRMSNMKIFRCVFELFPKCWSRRERI